MGEILLKVAGLACLSLISKEDIVCIPRAGTIMGCRHPRMGRGGHQQPLKHTSITAARCRPRCSHLVLDICDAFMTANRAKMRATHLKFKELSG